MSNFIEILTVQNCNILVNIDDISEVHNSDIGAVILKRTNGEFIKTVIPYEKVRSMLLENADGRETFRHNRPKRVKCIETGVVYPSMHAAAKAFHVNQASITHHLNGRAKTCRGCHFEYVEEGENGGC